MTSDTIDIFDKEILATKKPFNFYLLISIFVGLSVLLFTVIIIRQLNFEGSFTTFIIFFIIAAIFYANFGQYLATIRLYGHRIEVNYLFPWNKSLVFKFDKLTELDYKDIPFQNGRQRWYVGGKWLYLKNEKKEVCQFKYNINNSADKILLEELSKNHS
jgi:predicted membrane channel-forming protein YqfA (hemolysin III family)